MKKISDVLSWRCIQNNKQGHIVARLGEEEDHFLGKCKECYLLHKEGKTFYTEAEFKNGSGRADIYVVDDELAIEIVSSERQDSIDRKRKEYPCDVKVVRV